MNNFRFRITQFKNSYTWYVIQMEDYKYQATFYTDFDAIDSLMKFLKNVAENKHAIFKNYAPNQEHILRFTAQCRSIGKLELLSYFHHNMEPMEDGTIPGLFYEMNVDRLALVSDCYNEIKKLYSNKEFITFQNDKVYDYYDKYPEWDYDIAFIIEKYLKAHQQNVYTRDIA